jgi:3-isopropylmalate dehydrogenase
MDAARRHPDVALDHMYVDNCAMQLILQPSRFDVVLTENMFGDILSDEGGAVVGSLGLLPSASLGARGGLYEPVHGSAPDLAGRDIANPIGTIGSVALMLRHSFGLPHEADAVDAAIGRALDDGLRTMDLNPPEGTAIGCRQMTTAIIERLG